MHTQDIDSLLSENTYPGRGILLGRSADNRYAVAAYFIMGRSENSRNRVFIETEDGIRTQAFDPSKMTDPSLIIYAPVRIARGHTIVTNGDQTDTIYDGLTAGQSMAQALTSRTFEPDAPNYTPRISGVITPAGDYALSILKSADGDPSSCRRYTYTYESPIAGQGHFIHTYLRDGSPLPSFDGEPRQVALTAPEPAALASALWASLNAENRVSLFVRYIPLDGGACKSVVINKNSGKA
ncbi:MAG: IMP cyclohydrolase [Oscillospiraceae bacterium]|nr:IMP cyclohydrolase [Oscillospiraceae bacterium]